MFHRRRFLAAATALALQAACASAPEIPETTIALSVTGAPDMNGGAPAQVKVYYLNSPNQFASSDFFTVFETPESLGSDLVEVSAFSLVPGRNVTDSKRFQQPPAAIGVVAAFRDINGRFLAVKPLVADTLNPVAVTLSGNSVLIR